MKKAVILDVGIPLALLFGLTVIFWITDLDLAIQRRFFVPGEGWVAKDAGLWQFLYDYGPLPAILLSVAALGVLIGSFRFRSVKPYRKVALFFVLLILIGPGLVVNSIFKEHWGRPRPRDVVDFRGSKEFHYVWEKGVDGEGHSFPSGHASMGFFLLSPFFIFRRTSKKWAIGFLAVGMSCGLLIGLGRMVQGGHFASDVIWAGGFVYLCGLGLFYLLRPDRHLPLSIPEFHLPIDREDIAFIRLMLGAMTVILWASFMTVLKSTLRQVIATAAHIVTKKVPNTVLRCQTVYLPSFKRKCLIPLWKLWLTSLISFLKRTEEVLQSIQKKLAKF